MLVGFRVLRGWDFLFSRGFKRNEFLITPWFLAAGAVARMTCRPPANDAARQRLLVVRLRSR